MKARKNEVHAAFARGYAQAYAEICGAAPVATATNWFKEWAIATDFWAIRNGRTWFDVSCLATCCAARTSAPTADSNEERFLRFSRAWFPNFLLPKSKRHIPVAVRRQVFERDGRCCVYCSATEMLALDHIHPWSMGGTNDVDNLQVLCRSCNSTKGAKVDYEPLSLVGGTR